MSDDYGTSMHTGVCALPGCPELVSNVDHAVRRGYCEKHVGEAILEAIDNLGGHIDQLTNQMDRVARAMERLDQP